MSRCPSIAQKVSGEHADDGRGRRSRSAKGAWRRARITEERDYGSERCACTRCRLPRSHQGLQCSRRCAIEFIVEKAPKDIRLKEEALYFGVMVPGKGNSGAKTLLVSRPRKERLSSVAHVAEGCTLIASPVDGRSFGLAIVCALL